mmetsp:Transcript_13513/g.24190  ORF Transcript_13513/g.24190 Transcript_13513/m.24190 type:complete len:388 (+) Transcript_13513:1441-2604(+)
MRQTIALVNVIPHQLLVQPHALQKRLRVGDPLFVKRSPHLLISRRDEVLDLHLLEFPRSKDEVSRGDFVSKRLADLCDPERDLLPRRPQHVFEVDENPLRRLGPQVGHRGAVLHGPDVRLKHEVEIPRHGQRRLAAPGGGDLRHGFLRHLGQIREFERLDLLSLAIVLPQQFFGLRLRRLFHVRVVRLEDADETHRRAALLQYHRGAEELIRPVSQLGLLAIHHGVAEPIQMPRTLPRGGIVNDTAVNSHDVLSTLYEVGPECILDVLLQFGTEGTVIEEAGESVVDFGGGEDDAATFAERDDVFHFYLVVGFCIFDGDVALLLFRCFGGGFGGGVDDSDASAHRSSSGMTEGWRGNGAQTEADGAVEREEHGQRHAAIGRHCFDDS